MEGAFGYRKPFIKLDFSKNPFYFILLVGVCIFCFYDFLRDIVSSQ